MLDVLQKGGESCRYLLKPADLCINREGESVAGGGGAVRGWGGGRD